MDLTVVKAIETPTSEAEAEAEVLVDLELIYG
jgi:hypothetical protein